MSALTIVLALGIVVLVIGQQVLGAAVKGRRLVLLPAVLTAVGIVDLAGQEVHPSGLDVTLIAVSGAIAVAVGLGLGALTRLERRDGYLWAQLPVRGLWLWAGLVLSRLAISGVAHAGGAHVAAGTSALLLVLGLNRLAQAAVVAPRAIRAGIPFAPEKDGRVFGGQWFGPDASRG